MTFKALLEKFPKAKPEDLARAIERFLNLWTRHQWKRERLAPSFYLNDVSVDPKTWCRFPILSGEHPRELQEMWVEVKMWLKNE
jgi:NAD+ synthase (glutamine-hydrolysing)